MIGDRDRAITSCSVAKASIRTPSALLTKSNFWRLSFSQRFCCISSDCGWVKHSVRVRRGVEP
jgi:hypothetical protein